MIRSYWVLLPVAVLAALVFRVCPGYAAGTDNEASWPEFHGPNRDSISLEKGLLKEWPKQGPELIWKFSGCGGGYSGVSIADGMVFTAGDFDDGENVIALDMDGKLLWRSPNGESWNGPHPGSRTTPTYDDGVLYHMNPTGRLAALKAESGKEIWSIDLRARFGAQFGIWAMAENIVVDGSLLLCMPGGSKGFVVALDKTSGRTIWANTELEEGAAYCSGIIVTHRGLRQFITVGQKSVVGVDVRTGKLLWSHPWVAPHDQNVTTPVFHDGYVFVTSGHSAGGALLKIAPDSRGVAKVWSDKSLDNCHGGVILIDGCLYGSGCRKGGKTFFCVDFLTGECKQLDKNLKKASLTYADGMLYGLTERGLMFLMKITPGGFNLVSRFDLPPAGRGPSFAHPVVCGGKLYVRHGPNLYVYSIATLAGS